MSLDCLLMYRLLIYYFVKNFNKNMFKKKKRMDR